MGSQAVATGSCSDVLNQTRQQNTAINGSDTGKSRVNATAVHSVSHENSFLMGTSLDLKCFNPLKDVTNQHQNKTHLYSELHASHSRKHLGAEGSGNSGAYELQCSNNGASSSGKIFNQIGAQPDQRAIGSFIINDGKGYVH